MDDFRICQFCGCRTNAHLRRCCDEGYTEDAVNSKNRNMKVITVWTTHSSNDERGSNDKLIGIFLDEKTAKAHAKGQGWWGGEGNVSKRKAIQVDNNLVYLLDWDCESPVELGVNLVDKTRQKKLNALNKLTKEERQLLGIEE